MRVLLPAPIRDRLAATPETGMGYHRVDLVLRDGRRLRGVVVLNGELAELPDAAGRVDGVDIVEMAPATE